MNEPWHTLVREHLAKAEGLAENLDIDGMGAFEGPLDDRPPSRIVAEPHPAGRLTLVSGPAGSGKTRYLAQVAQALAAGGMAPSHIFHLNCTDPRLPRNLDSAALGAIMETYFDAVPAARREPFAVLLDEAGAIPSWPAFAQILLDTYPARIWAASPAASWLTEAGRAGLAPVRAVVHVGETARTTLDRLLRHHDDGFDGLGDVLSRFYLHGRAASLSPGEAVANQRARFRAACRAIALQELPTAPLPLIERTAALLLAGTGRAPSLSGIQRALASEGVATTRATLSRIACALEEARLLVRVTDVRRRDTANPRSAPLVIAADHGMAAALGGPVPDEPAFTAALVGAQLAEDDPARPLFTCATGVPGATVFVRTDRVGGNIIEVTAAYGRAAPHGLPGRLTDGLVALSRAHGLPRITVVAPPSVAIAEAPGPLEVISVPRWLLKRTGLIS